MIHIAKTHLCHLVISVVLFLSACNGRETLEVDQKSGDISINSNIEQEVLLDNTVPYCWQKPLEPLAARVEVLLDASGSMTGFTGSMPQMIDWVRKAISQLNGTSIDLGAGNYLLGQFREGAGVANITRWSDKPATYKPAGNTNLHEAIHRAGNADLSFIITDGVAATGVSGDAQCPGGVDAGCVARALQNVLHSYASEGGNNEPGLWIIPILSEYSGKFYTEQSINPQTFDPSVAVAKVEADLNSTVAVSSPSTDASSRLVFNYQGPRYLLIFVLARQADLGREAVYQLINATGLAGIGYSQNGQGSSGKNLTALIPFELYPGLQNGFKWNSLTEASDPSLFDGTMDVNFESGSETVKVGCLPEESGKGAYILSGTKITSGPSCVNLHVLPAFAYELEDRSLNKDIDAEDAVTVVNKSNSEGPILQISLSCPAAAAMPNCDTSRVETVWSAVTRYKKSADCIKDNTCNHDSYRIIRDLSTLNPSQEPHRIYGIAELVENFYRAVSSDERRIGLANLRFCSF